MRLTELTASVETYAQTYSLTAVINSALCIGSGGSSGSLADKPIVRNAENRLIIPGSHLKGCLRHECEKLARSLGLQVSESPNPGLMMQTPNCWISKIFGNPVSASCLVVDDLICTSSAVELPTEVIRPGVTINRRRGTAEDDKLYFLETSPPNQSLSFTGKIHLIQPPDYALPLLVAGLHHIRALGGSKSAGLGWLTWQLPDALKLDANHPGWAALRRGE
ncbi:MAG: RAMP superfamily CRISPR-associated protein [Leptolyngbyaceae cyanobacterium]